MSLKTKLFDIEMQSPFVLGSGPLTYGSEGMIRAHEMGIGAVVTKTIRDKAAQNPFPHIANTGKDSLINAEKWADIEGQKWIDKEIPEAKEAGAVVIGSIGHFPQEAENWVEKVDKAGADIIELVSYNRDAILPMVKKARKLTQKPLLVKVSPNWSDPVDVALKAFDIGANGITAIDSIGPVLRIDINKEKPLVGGENGYGWMTGGALKPISLRIVADIASQTDKPVVGIGGVITGEDAVEMMMAGASAVGVCSAPILKGLEYIRDLNNKIDNLVDELGYNQIADLKGLALKNLPKNELMNKFKFNFNKEICIQCRKCVDLCPYQARGLDDLDMTLNKNRCRYCGLCSSICPTDALNMERG